MKKVFGNLFNIHIKKFHNTSPITNNQYGQMFVLTLIVLTVVMLTTVAIITGALTFSQSSKYSTEVVQATNLAEAGIDKAVASLNKVSGSYNGEPETSLGDGTYTVTITNIDSNTKKITSTGYIPNQANAKSKKEISILVSKGEGVSFSYGVQVGEGGFIMEGGSRINGSVYANSDINLSGGAVITGDAYVAGGTQPIADQQSDCTDPNCTDLIFGKNVSGNDQFDIAQSFVPSQTAAVNKVALKLKKINNPANFTVRILGDNNGSPHKGQVRATGTLNANLVTGNYGFTEVSLSPAYVLTAGTKYWIVVDTCGNNTNCDSYSDYWAWSADTLQSYNSGEAKWSPRWNANGTPVWSNINADLGFKVYMGGVTTKIAGSGSSFVNGSAYANTLTADNSTALQIGQHAYYQTELNIRVHGQNCSNNSYCHPGSPDPPTSQFPVSQANIDAWKDEADDSVHNGDLTIQWPCTTNLTKKKYNGNVTVQGGCTITTETPVWITGNFTVTSGSTVKLAPSYGTTSGVIIVDGKIVLNGGSKFQGSGDPLSYLMALSTYSGSGDDAIVVSGGNSSSIVYAPFGSIKLEGGTHLREVTAHKLKLSGGAIVTYETGVENPFFTSGPTGSYSVIKGTYQVK